MKFLAVWFLGSQLILSAFRVRMYKGSVIYVIGETNLNWLFRTRMDDGSIILLIWVRNYIGVA